MLEDSNLQPDDAPLNENGAISPAVVEKKKSYKLFYALGAVLVVAVILIAFMVPPGMGDSIPLALEYSVGEEMVYDASVSISGSDNSLLSDLAADSQISLRVVDFDGEYYTLNYSMSVDVPGYEGDTTFSFQQKVNQTGYVNLNTMFSSIPDMSGAAISGFFTQSQAKVGETLEIPLSLGNSEFGISGTLRVKFGEPEEITVPAGTYNVFRVDFSSEDLSINYDFPAEVVGEDLSSSISINITGYQYLEYGTCKEIKSSVSADLSLDLSIFSYSMSLSMNNQLKEHHR